MEQYTSIMIILCTGILLGWVYRGYCEVRRLKALNRDLMSSDNMVLEPKNGSVNIREIEWPKDIEEYLACYDIHKLSGIECGHYIKYNHIRKLMDGYAKHKVSEKTREISVNLKKLKNGKLIVKNLNL